MAIGEFHLYGADADLPVPRKMVQLAVQHRLMLHAHSDADAIERLFRQDPAARILWAHAGFESPARVRELLAKHKQLWADLAFRSDHGPGGKVAADWRPVFLEFSDRFMVAPTRSRLSACSTCRARVVVPGLARRSASDVAERIAWKNGEALFGGALGKRP